MAYLGSFPGNDPMRLRFRHKPALSQLGDKNTEISSNESFDNFDADVLPIACLIGYHPTIW